MKRVSMEQVIPFIGLGGLLGLGLYFNIEAIIQQARVVPLKQPLMKGKSISLKGNKTVSYSRPVHQHRASRHL